MKNVAFVLNIVSEMLQHFRINVTHIFFAGGKVEPFIIGVDDYYEDAEITTIRTDDGFYGVVTAGVLTGGTALRKSYMFDGTTWVEAAAMPTQRVRPMCSLLEMDDGEVRFILLLFEAICISFLFV